MSLVVVIGGIVLQSARPMAPDTQKRTPNRLIHEKSPYLLQHAYNPVDWYPWGEEALARAKREDRPIFLSIGYSTCYWCHVMEQESFENPQIAQLMNAHFVSVKVDREERPDIDALYMAAVQAMSGAGGWPMSVFLTPEGKPFWGGTYFPPEDRWGRPGFATVLDRIADVWKTKRQEILESSQGITEAIQAATQPGTTVPLTAETLESAVRQFTQQFDERFGGFGPAPKFPRPHSLSFLLRAWQRTRDPRVLEMVQRTLEAMADGGIHDQLGGGFHRYSTDERWLVPHFEKMLYDQALLARAYLEAYQVTGKDLYAEVARGIFEYVLRDMHDPQGGFYAAEDAGEVGKEGEFYVWTPQEIEQVLGAEDAKLFNRVYGVTPEGNFEHHTTILSIAAPREGAAGAEARAKLLAARGRRARPHRDDKILTDWNGLMIGALALGGRVLDEPRYLDAAAGAARFLLDHSRQGEQLLHRYREGEAAIPAFLDDYAFFSWGLLELYEATGDPLWLARAKQLADQMVRHQWDEAGGGFSVSGARNERLIAKTKELYDGALPSGNSVAALVLVRLAQVTMDKTLHGYAERLFQTFSSQAQQLPSAFPQFLIALDGWLGPSQEIVIAGDPAKPDTQDMLRLVRQRFLPRAVLILHPAAARAKDIEALVPFVKEQRPLEGRATAYVCQGYACNLPTSDLNQLTALLDSLAAPVGSR